MELTAPEIRVLGCLLEKQRTTPDVYPLSLNSLRLACNQSTNRDPVVRYDEATLREALRRLHRRGLVRLASGHTSRAEKYRHLLADALPMGPDEQAVMCVLMLRGVQTPGELKQRTDRMHAFADLGAVHDTLARLIERGLVARLERRPGQKEERYVHLLAGEEDEGVDGSSIAASTATPGGTAAAGAAPGLPAAGDAAALAQLTERVARLEREVGELRRLSGERPAENPMHEHSLELEADGSEGEGSVSDSACRIDQPDARPGPAARAH
ncbi:MAG: YceH family protein [Solirubrobacterales bacterium]|nr:YceH family protein [Solirubrobacterales bacterium]